MSDEATPAQNPAPKQKRWFRGAASKPQISPEAAQREGAIVRHAMDHLDPATVRDFLNAYDASIGGTPIAVAAASAEGARAVEELIGTLAQRRRGGA